MWGWSVYVTPPAPRGTLVQWGHLPPVPNPYRFALPSPLCHRSRWASCLSAPHNPPPPPCHRLSATVTPRRELPPSLACLSPAERPKRPFPVPRRPCSQWINVEDSKRPQSFQAVGRELLGARGEKVIVVFVVMCGNFDIVSGRFSRMSRLHTAPHTRRVMRSQWPCMSRADGLQPRRYARRTRLS